MLAQLRYLPFWKVNALDYGLQDGQSELLVCPFVTILNSKSLLSCAVHFRGEVKSIQTEVL
jgi:hypothetical protein